MAGELGAPPILSTPDVHILNEIAPTSILKSDHPLSDEEFKTRYEIQRTISEIKQRRWSRVALQFPDKMLPDSARVFQLLARGLREEEIEKPLASKGTEATLTADSQVVKKVENLALDGKTRRVKLTILADTSYGSCCVDEIAAEHVDADGIIHYGRACLSPTSRLPVIHVFTKTDLEPTWVEKSFRDTFPDLSSKVIITSDVTYEDYVTEIFESLTQKGYSNIFAASIIHEPSSPIPNRTIPDSVVRHPESLRDWQLFYISEPPTSLLLTLSSRISAFHIYPTDQRSPGPQKSLVASTSLLLRRRYGLVTSLTTVSIWGILINTLSVKNYLHMVDHVRQQISAAGKKSYLFVVGKLNAAKVANFSEIGGWVVIGCWESSLIDSKEFYKPVITPFELELALKKDEERVWTGAWSGDFQRILDASDANEKTVTDDPHSGSGSFEAVGGHLDGEFGSEEESAPPEYDLRAGRYVSATRPMKAMLSDTPVSGSNGKSSQSTALTRKAKGDMVAINGIASPAANFLKTQRTWQGLGSDFDVPHGEEGSERGALMQEGRTGIARGYTVADSDRT